MIYNILHLSDMEGIFDWEYSLDFEKWTLLTKHAILFDIHFHFRFVEFLFPPFFRSHLLHHIWILISLHIV